MSILHYSRHLEINRSQWDALITQVPNGLIYGLSWYLDSVSPGWEAIVKEQEGRYVAVMPLPVQTKFGFRYLKQPLFAQQLGMFYDEPLTVAEWQEVGSLLRKRFRMVTRYSFNVSNIDLLKNSGLGVEVQAFKTYYLSLRPTYDQLVKGYKANRRWRLNQAKRRTLYVRPANDIDLMLRMFHHNTASKIYGVVGEAYEYRLLRALYAQAAERGMAKMWQAQTADGEVLAMILLFRFNQQFIYIFNASTAEGKEAGAISLLLDEVFRTHAGQAITFDFEAPEVASIAHFYGSFGSTEMPFPSISYNQLPGPLQKIKALRTALLRRIHSHSR